MLLPVHRKQTKQSFQRRPNEVPKTPYMLATLFLHFICVDLFKASPELQGKRRSPQYLSSIVNVGLTDRDYILKYTNL